MSEPTLNYDAFIAALDDDTPPAAANMALRALWYDANGKEDSAMRAAKADGGLNCQRVQGYLHRKAGDEGKARVAYWRAGLKPWDGTFEDEWRDILRAIMTEFPVASAYGA